MELTSKRSKMKKHSKRKRLSAPTQIEPDADMAGLIIKIHQQLVFLEKKIDTLINQSSVRPSEPRQFSKPAQRFDNSFRQGEGRQDNSFREKTFTKAICADCGKECEVPFKPSGDRPVYCKDCFARRKAASPFKASVDHRPGEGERVRQRPAHKYASAENRRPYGKKTFVRNRKKRS